MRMVNSECFKYMEGMESGSIDTIITDPPYGLRMMNHKWDYDVPSSTIWRACLNVLRPGGTRLVFAGSRTQHRMAVVIEDAGFMLKDCIMWIYGSGFPKATDISKQMSKSKRAYILSEVSKEWNGWKSHGLKPAYEPILVCMKANDGTYAENALSHGVSGLNIDGGRIGRKNGDRFEYGVDGDEPSQTGKNCYSKYERTAYSVHSQGRFPANVILDEEAGEMLGEPSRFFYCAKASKSERNEGNHHPTVKPLKLMEYLCKLTSTPTGGVVFDPFMGSGTTGIACKNVGRKFIGCEMDEDYFEIAKKRICA